MIRGIHHVALVTDDLERALRFYRDALGFTEITGGGWRPGPEGSSIHDRVVGLEGSGADAVMLSAGNLILELFQYSSPAVEGEIPTSQANMKGWRHIGLDVVNIDDVYERMCAAGGIFDRPPQDLGFVKAVYGRDPDGNLIEIMELIGENHPMELKALRVLERQQD